jgi:hypothetical protein
VQKPPTALNVIYKIISENSLQEMAKKLVHAFSDTTKILTILQILSAKNVLTTVFLAEVIPHVMHATKQLDFF